MNAATEPRRLPVAASGGGEVVSMRRDELEQGLRDARALGDKAASTRERAGFRRTLDELGAAHLAELTRRDAVTLELQRSAHAHGFHKAAWWFGLPAFVLGGAAMALVLLASQGVIFDAAARNARENAMTGAIIRSGTPQE